MLMKFKMFLFLWHTDSIGLITTIVHCNLPQFNWVKQVNNTAGVRSAMTLNFSIEFSPNTQSWQC